MGDKEGGMGERKEEREGERERLRKEEIETKSYNTDWAPGSINTLKSSPLVLMLYEPIKFIPCPPPGFGLVPTD